MSSALVLVGTQQVLPLASRLVVGIRLQGTIGHIDPAHPYIIKPRPYAAYLAETLRRLECTVALFVPVNTDQSASMMDHFNHRDFCVPFKYVQDHAKITGIGGGRGNRKAGLAPNNYTEYLRMLAHEANGTGTATDRILFVDSEVNYRFSPVQTVVLDAYEPLTRRQQRELAQQQLSSAFGDVSSRQARRYAAALSRATKTTVQHRAALRAQHVLDEMAAQQRHTDFLVTEQAQVPLSAGGGSGGGSEDAAQPGSADDRSDFRRYARHPSAPSSSPSPSSGTPAATTGKAGKTDAAGAEPNSDNTSMSRAVAINLEDYSLVALAEMIAEMSASDGSVAEYLKTEPLIEKVEVPFHGKANYLPPENCDNIDLLNWDEIKVMEKAATDTGVPETLTETADHKDFFQ